ncbi:MAG: DUF6596 domain-containing protein [Myxococcota bacterium]
MVAGGEDGARRAAEAAARRSYGRLVAFLAARSHDVAAAEDALAEAFRAALEQWPEQGVPARPEAWLLTAARRRLLDEARKDGVRAARASAIALAAEEAAARVDPASAEPFPDDRLALLFVCAHPAIDAAARTPLMLQAVLGLDAARIASALCVSPAAMSQRLVRAKAKIRDAGIAFAVPERREWGERLEAVLDAIYAAFTRGQDDAAAGVDSGGRDLADEALHLARLVVALLPDDPEARGLLALLLFCESRRAARRGPDGRYIALAEQDVARWSAAAIAEGEEQLARASAAATLGRFQLEALIQAAHARRVHGEPTDWALIAQVYRGLVRVAPTIGAHVGLAAALSEVDAAAGLAVLDALPAPETAAYQPYHAVRAALLRRLGRHAEAREAYTRHRAQRGRGRARVPAGGARGAALSALRSAPRRCAARGRGSRSSAPTRRRCGRR